MINIANDLTIIRRNGGITSGLNVVLSAGTDLSVGGDLSIATDISNLTSGANIDVLADRNLTVGGSLALLTVATAESGTGGNITLNVGHNLTTDSGGDTSLFVNNINRSCQWRENSRYDRRESSDQQSNDSTLEQCGRNRYRRQC